MRVHHPRQSLALLLSAVALAVCAPAAFAAQPEPTTALEAGPFARATAVFDVRVTSVTDVRAPGGAFGRQVVQARVLQTFKGSATQGQTVSLIVVGQRPTLDPARPSVPYFRKGRHERYVVFVTRLRGRYAWQLQTLYDAEGRVGAEKVAAVAAVARWAAIRDPDTKARTTLRDLLAMLKGRGRWTRPHAARELAYLAQARPGVFDRRTVGQLNRLAAVGGDNDLRFWLRRVSQILQQQGSTAAKKGKGGAGGDPWRDAFEAAPDAEDRRLLLGRLLQGGAESFDKHGWWAWVRLEPSSRVWLLGAMVSARLGTATSRLRALYGSASSSEVREALVRTVGLLGGQADVAWLAERLASVQARRPALIALARIRTPKALEHLKVAHKAAASPDEAAWIEHLLSAAFVSGDKR